MSITVINTKATKENIRGLFKRKGLTVSKVRKELELGSTQAVYKWLNTEIKDMPSLDNLVLLAELLECGLDDIIITQKAS